MTQRFCRQRRLTILTGAWWVLFASLFLLSGTSSSFVSHVELRLGEETGPFTTMCYAYKYFKVDVTDPCSDLVVKVTHVSGQPDIYISKDPDQYPSLNGLTWSSYEWDSDTVTINSWDPEFEAGTYYIGVHSYCGDDVHADDYEAHYYIQAEAVTSNHPDTVDMFDSTVSGLIQAEEYQYYRFCVPDDCTNVIVHLDNCIDPGMCPTTYAWPELLISRSTPTPTIDSHSWKLAQITHRSIVLDHTDSDFTPGHYYIGVYGWCTPDEHCPDLASCGPCSYVNDTVFDLSVQSVDIPESYCLTGGVGRMGVESLWTPVLSFICLILHSNR